MVIEEEMRATKVARNPHAIGFPGAGYRLDSRHRVAFCQVMAGRAEDALATYRSAALFDPAISEWLDRFKRLIVDPNALAKCRDLWGLIDTAELPDEKAAIALITAQKEPYLFCESWWFVAYVSLYRRGWIRAAYAAKEMAARVARKSAPPPSSISPERAAEVSTAYIDKGKLDEAKQYLARSSPSDEAAENLSRFVALLAEQGLRRSRPISTASPESEFARLVAGRSIAIVAPGDTAAEHGDEIDDFDLVVRTNFRSHQIVRQQCRKIGARTDICYYNGNFEPENREEIVLNLRQHPIPFIVLRFPDEQALNLYRGVTPVRVSRMANPFYRMNSYAIPKIVFDLLNFSPGRMKIFNADFFLGARPHYSGYLSYDIKLVQSFLGHDVLRNFRLLKLWLEAGKVEADEVLSEILSLTESEVIDRVAQRISAASVAAQ